MLENTAPSTDQARRGAPAGVPAPPASTGACLSKTKFTGGRGFLLRNRSTGQIVEFDPVKARLSRMKRRVWNWSRALKSLEGDYRKIMVTLTYRSGATWKAGHIRDYMLRVRKVLGSGLLAYAWTAELQKRGAVHYHVILVMRKNSWIPRSDASKLWPWGMTKTESAKYPWYIVTYVGKEYQKGLDPDLGFPKGLRIFSVFISKGLVDDMAMYSFKLSTFPIWVVDIASGLGVLVSVRRDPGGGYLISGTLYRSDWEFLHGVYPLHILPKH